MCDISKYFLIFFSLRNELAESYSIKLAIYLPIPSNPSAQRFSVSELLDVPMVLAVNELDPKPPWFGSQPVNPSIIFRPEISPLSLSLSLSVISISLPRSEKLRRASSWPWKPRIKTKERLPPRKQNHVTDPDSSLSRTRLHLAHSQRNLCAAN